MRWLAERLGGDEAMKRIAGRVVLVVACVVGLDAVLHVAGRW